MIDVPAVIRSYLVAQTPLTTLTSTRIWAETDYPATGYNPAVGGAVIFRIRGGRAGDMLNPSVQFRCYGASESVANSVYRALFDALHEARADGYGISYAENEVLGQTLRELEAGPAGGWIFNLSYFRFWLNDTD